MLRWKDRWGKHIKTWESAIAKGREPPAAYYECPEISIHLTAIWKAFEELSTERSIGMGVGNIPASKIRRYIQDELDLWGDAQDRAYSILRKVDDDYVSRANSSAKTSDGEPMADVVKADDLSGVKQLVRRLGKSKKVK